MIQVCPKDLPALLRQVEHAVDRPAAPTREGAPMSDMRRRDVITLLGGAAAAWPLAARAQQSQRIRRVGVLMAVAESDVDVRSGVAIFQQSLQELGWTDGRNLRIDYRWGDADAVRIQALAKE